MKKQFHLEKLIRKNILGLQPYSSARDEYKEVGAEMIFLDANENPFPSATHRYPDPHQINLKKRIAEVNAVSTENIVLGNGSDEILDLLFRAFCQPREDEIITLPPTYGMYKVLAELNEIYNREIILLPDFQPDVETIFEQITSKTKIIFFCSPNNPTGNLINQSAIEKVLSNFHGLVVIDEAYIHYTNFTSWITHLEKFPNLVIIQTLSKAFGQAGIRLGICFASKAICSVLKKIKPPYNVNLLTQKAAMDCLEAIEDYEVQKELIVSEREKLSKELSKISFIQEIIPSEANFLLCKVDVAEKRYQQLLNFGIVVRNRSTQARCEQTLRITLGTPEENKTLIKILQKM